MGLRDRNHQDRAILCSIRYVGGRVPRRNYKTTEARRRFTGLEVQNEDYEILMTNGKRVKKITINGTSGPNAWNKAIRAGLNEYDETMPGHWWPIEVSRGDWKYSAN